jgi:apolipoprotein D and lipocalin family protein
MKLPKIASLIGSAFVALLSSCATSPSKLPLKTVPKLDLKRFMGDWYVFAHIPYSLEKGKVGTLDRYALRPDGRIQNSFLFRRYSLDSPLEEWKGVAWVHDKASNAEWRVQFVWPFRMPYLVIDLDPDYQWAVIGYPSRKLAWVLSRKTTLGDSTYRGILNRMEMQGYDTSLLVKVPQRPASISTRRR